jgi:UDP-N-acetylmuramate dehydrogenase
MRIEENYPLLKHNTFHLDVKTRWFVEYESEEDLQRLMRDEYFLSQPVWHIGQGSNLLFLNDYEGVIVHSGIKGINVLKENEDSVWVQAGAAEDWDGFVAACVERGWGGVENLSLIPGEVGASAVQNIGAYGAEASDCIEEVHAYHFPSNTKRIFTNAECRYSYRHSLFKEKENKGLYYITHVVYRLAKHPEYRLDYGNLRSLLDETEVNLHTLRAAVCAIRREKLPDPDTEGNAGSFFMNPYLCKAHYEALKTQYPDMPHYPVDAEVVKVPAAWLIEQCGLRGKSLGGAAVSEKQPLVIVNRSGASGKEIALLADQISRTVKEKFEIDLRPEVNYIM